MAVPLVAPESFPRRQACYRFERDGVSVVLGAGASLAHAEHFHSRRRVHSNPPLDYTFFEKIRALEISVPRELRAYARKVPLVDPFEESEHRVRMEEFFKDLFFDFEQASPDDSITTAYAQLIRLYARVLRETTNWLGDDNRRGGPVGQILQAAAQRDGSLAIITFNHDLVIENELQKRRRLRRRWCLDEGYGSFGQRLTIARGSQPNSGTEFRNHDGECDHGHPISVLKLHGSLNWYVRIRGRSPSNRVLTGATGQPPNVWTLSSRNIPHELTFTRSGRGRNVWHSWPVIIPPIYGKQALIRAFTDSVWGDHARQALQDSERVLFFGYSMPALDIQAEKLFERAVRMNTNLQWIDVVNRAPDAAHRYAGIAGGKSVRWYRSWRDFMEVDGFRTQT